MRKQTTFTPTQTMDLETNRIPQGMEWERIVLPSPFRALFVIPCQGLEQALRAQARKLLRWATGTARQWCRGAA